MFFSSFVSFLIFSFIYRGSSLLAAVFTLFKRKKSVKENAISQCDHTSFSTQLVIHIIITGTNNLKMVIMSVVLIIFFIILCITEP